MAIVDLPDARRIHEAAERAATAGDLASAESLLREAARIQEAAFGALHPDLANTLNNLAIVTEKTGRMGEAEALYRRAWEIASASLPVHHPMVAASRQNLEDFCRARGLPIETPAAETPAPVTAVSPPAAPETAPYTAPTDRKGSGALVWIGLGAVVLAAAAFFVWRPLSSRETAAPAPVAQPPAPPASAAAPAPPAPAPPPATPPPIERPAQPVVAPPVADRDGLKPSAEAMTLATVQLCQTFAISGASWQCEPAGDSVSQGRLVLLTRVRSPRDAEVVHRWYRGDTLRQSVKLMIRANPTEGYRTYSRQTVDGGADWRVEVRSADGELLHEQRFAVR